jgi:3-oxoacid CoA-transferase subunit A
MISSYVGENKEFERQYLAGELELEFTPAGHAGRADARRRRGHSRLLHQDRRRHAGGRGQGSASFDGEDLRPGTRHLPICRWSRPGRPTRPATCVFRKTARNFNPPAATCGKVCVVEVEEIVRPAA